MHGGTTRHSFANLRAVVCAVAETSSASPGSTSGASVTMASRKPLIDFASPPVAASARMRNAEAKIRLRMTVLDGPKIAVARITQPRNDLPSFIQLRIDRNSNDSHGWSLYRCEFPFGQLTAHTNETWL